MSKTALITGANGFVGSHLAELLLERGWAVRCLVRESADLRWVPTDRVDIRYGEVTNPKSLEGSVAGVDVVFHVAGTTRSKSETGYMEVNAGGTRNILARARLEAPSLDRFVLVSSLAAAGPTDYGRPLRETDTPAPNSAYGMSKLQGEVELRDGAGALPWTILRPAAVYGPRDVAFAILAKMSSRGWVVCFSGPTQLAGIVHVSDLVVGIADAATEESTVGGTYFLANPEPSDFNTIGRVMAEAMGVRPRNLLVPRGLVPAIGFVAGLVSRVSGKPNPLSSDRIKDLMAQAWTCDISRAKEDFAFRPEIELKTGIREIVTWYQQEGWV